MNKFIRKTLFVSIGFVLSIFLFIALRVVFVQSISWKVPQDKNVLFMGASHIACGINTQKFPSAINIASGSERYLFTYLKLRNLIEANSHIDTLLLEFAPTDIQPNADSKYFQKNEMSHFIPLYFPFFTQTEWQIFKDYKLYISTLLTKKGGKNIPFDLPDFGGHTPAYNEYDPGAKPTPPGKWLDSGNSINLHYLEKIIEICSQHNIQLLFLYMPMVNKAYYYNIEQFYNTYKEKYSNVLLLDYSDWKCPNSYRHDEHHLNYKGALHFTEHLKSGLKKNRVLSTHRGS